MGHRTKQHTQITAVSQYSGPLPRPEDLIRYNDAVPGAAERILAMAEREMNHRHESERKILKNRIRLSILSTILSFISVLIMSILVGYSLICREVQYCRGGHNRLYCNRGGCIYLCKGQQEQERIVTDMRIFISGNLNNVRLPLIFLYMRNLITFLIVGLVVSVCLNIYQCMNEG